MAGGMLVLRGSVAAALALASPAFAKDLTVTVDAHSAPWNTGINPKLFFGVGDGRPARIVIDRTIRAGVRITFKARGSTTTYEGDPQSFSPDGDRSMCSDFGITKWPSIYLAKGQHICLNGLIGAFISADGVVIGKPFAIGSAGSAVVPDGASALSLGINDDRFTDNNGQLTVDIHIPEASVIVEEGHETK